MDALNCPICGSDTSSSFLIAPDRFHGRYEKYKLLKCASCALVRLENPPGPDEMGIHYSDDYHRTIMAGGERAASSRWRSQRELITRWNNRGGSILDIGCSSGGFLGTMKSENWKLYGIELEPGPARKASAATGAEIFIGDALKAPFAPDSFDVITCFDLLEHVYQPSAFLGRVLAWLKPGGIVCAGLPNIESWEANMFGTFWYGLELPRHLFHFSPKSVRYTMNVLGFEELSLRTTPTSYAERSCSYLYCEVLRKLGGSPVPMAKESTASLFSRILHKGMRLSMVVPFGHLASLRGAGASMELVFRKPLSKLRATRKEQETVATVDKL